jgi:hypothetical protein
MRLRIVSLALLVISMSCGAQHVERTYNDKTLTIHMVGEGDSTSLYLTEHGAADYLYIEAFYYTDIKGQRLMLHKEVTTPVTKGDSWGIDVPLPIEKIEFLRVREMHLLTQSEFGRKP